MAFGKNPELLNTVGNFGQSAARYSNRARPARSGGGGGAKYFWTCYRPPTTESDTIRIVQGLYANDVVEGEGKDAKKATRMLPFFVVTEHYHAAMKRSVLCSAGAFAEFRDRREPCAGCDIFWETREKDENGKNRSAVSRSTKYVITILDYGKYHRIAEVDRDTGKVRMNERTKEPFTRWVKCVGLNCDACRGALETKNGHVTHWPMNYGQWLTLRKTDEEVGQHCKKCGGDKSVKPLAWLCRYCGQDIIDMGSTSLKMEEVRKMTEQMITCRGCSQVGFMEEFVQCEKCGVEGFAAKHINMVQTPDGWVMDQNQETVDDIRATLFDVDLGVRVTENGKQRLLTVYPRSAPGPVPAQFVASYKPLDLPKIYAPTPFRAQCQIFNYTPTGGGAPAPARPYGQQTEQPHEDESSEEEVSY